MTKREFYFLVAGIGISCVISYVIQDRENKKLEGDIRGLRRV